MALIASEVTSPPRIAAPRIIYDMPGRDYHNIAAMSASAVGSLIRSASHFWEWATTERPPSSAQAIGTLIHLGVLEPARFKDKVFVWTKPPERMSATDRKARDETHAAAAAAGNIVVEADDFARAARAIDSINRHPAARALLEGAKTEVTMLWQDRRHDIPCKARLDAIKGNIVVDLKTTSDASADAFARSAANYNYHAQAAMYSLAHEVCADSTPEAFVWIVVETEPPFGVACYQLETDAHAAGRDMVETAMARYSEALRSGRFNAYPQDIRPLRFPKWALVKREL